jgi:hypothetical protein
VAGIVLGVLGTVAGVTFALYLVGVLFEFRRLKTLGLPADQPVSSMPHDLLLVVGVRSLIVPALAAILTVAAVFLTSVAARRVGTRAGKLQRLLATVGLATIVVATAVFVAIPPGLRVEHAVLAALGVVVATGSGLVERRSTRIPHAKLGALACMLAAGIGVVYHHAMRPPVHFDYAEVLLARGGHESGFYVGRAGDEIFLAPSPDSMHTCRILEVIFTKEIRRMSLRRGKATTAASGSPAERRCVDARRRQ